MFTRTIDLPEAAVDRLLTVDDMRFEVGTPATWRYGIGWEREHFFVTYDEDDYEANRKAISALSWWKLEIDMGASQHQ